MKFTTQKIVFVTGKGGVGKSMAAAALAWREARAGKKVCLVELGDQSFYESFFETRGVGYEPSEIIPDFHLSLLTSNDCVREYIIHFIKVPKLYDLFFQNKIMKAFLNAAPAIGEIAILGKLTSDLRGVIPDDYDLYIVDGYSTGHALALLRAPSGLSATFKNGPVFDQAAHMDRIIKNPEHLHFVVVTLAEEMPVVETLELKDALKNEFNGRVSLILNKTLQPPVTASERHDLAHEIQDSGLQTFVRYLDDKERAQDHYRKQLLSAGFDSFSEVPLITEASNNQNLVELYSKYLESP
ncbi:MAG: arsenical pump-driving ATPase [Oligoflexia bacterium]|nr:arsenical pump-driving ATPase [Oligoflexia bacterium]